MTDITIIDEDLNNAPEESSGDGADEIDGTDDGESPAEADDSTDAEIRRRNNDLSEALEKTESDFRSTMMRIKEIHDKITKKKQ